MTQKIDDTFLRLIEIREDERGRLLPFLGGVMLPGVQSVDICAQANNPRICEIKIRVLGDAFKLAPHRTGGPIPGNKWGVYGERGGSDGVVTREDNEPRGAILR